MQNISKWSSILWLFVLLFVPGYARGQVSEPFILQNFGKQGYHAESQNWSVTMDRNGYVYAANNSGLLEFDGVEWSFYPSPGGAVMRSVAVDDSGRIYTSGYRDLGFWERDAFGDLVYTSLVPLAEHLFSKNEEFWNTVILGDRVYFHSFTSIFIYDGKEFEVIRPGDVVLSISPYAGSLLVHVSGQGLSRLENGQLIPLLDDDVLQNQVVHFCLELSGGDILIGTETEGLYIYRDGRLLPYLEEWKSYFSRNLLNRGQLNPNGDLVLGTILDGIIIFDSEGRLRSRISQEDGLQNNTVLGIHCSSSSEIWASLDQGLAYLSFEVDAAYRPYEYPEVGAIYAAALFGEEIYLATNRGVFYRTWNGEEDFTMVAGTQGQAWSCDVLNGQLLVSHNDGTFLIREHRAERLSQVGGGFNLTRNPLDPSMIIQSTYSNILFYENQQGRWRYASQLEGFNDLIRYIEMDHLGNLWASHMHRGIYRLILDGSQEVIVEEQYLGDSVFGTDHNLQVFKIENRIVFTSGERIFTYNDLEDRIVPYDLLNEGLGEYRRAHRVLPGPDHHYWLVSRSGIGLFRIFGNEIRKIREYPADIFGGHLIDGYENILPLDSTRGLLCMDNGFAILDAAAEAKSSSFGSRKMELKNMEISGRSGKTEKLELGDTALVIPFNRNSLSLHLAFPFFSGHSVLFQSMVEGLDLQWSQAKAVPEFEFTRIPFGDYTIRVRAVNQWNQLSQEANIALTVLPPWYLKRITVLAYLLIVFMLAFLGRYLLIQRIRQREQRIKDRQERELIRLRNENLNAELSFKSQELATSTMAMIRKNEFLMELKGTLKAQKDDLGTRYPEKYYHRVIRKIDENIGSMDDWNVFEIHFEKAHEDFLQKMITLYPHLSHSDLRLCAYLRMNLTSKEIAPLLRISYRGVENHRYRLRKKLHLKKDVNLTDFILSA